MPFSASAIRMALPPSPTLTSPASNAATACSSVVKRTKQNPLCDEWVSSGFFSAVFLCVCRISCTCSTWPNLYMSSAILRSSSSWGTPPRKTVFGSSTKSERLDGDDESDVSDGHGDSFSDGISLVCALSRDSTSIVSSRRLLACSTFLYYSVFGPAKKLRPGPHQGLLQRCCGREGRNGG